MTCIVGYVDKVKNSAFIGGDSAGVAGSSITIRKDEKVFKNGDFIIGCTTSFRMIQLLRFSFTPPEVKKDIYAYMCTDFVNAIRECFKNGGFLQKDTKGDEIGGTFLIGYKNRLFQIDSDFQVAENLNGIYAVGCGADYAIGALHQLSKTELNSKIKLIKALETAEFYSSGVSKPFIIKQTK